MIAITPSHIIALGGLALVAKIWIDVHDMIQQNIRLNTYAKISASVLEIVKIMREESIYRRNLIADATSGRK